LGFLGPWPFRRENPNLWLLDSLGFPWILSSESSLINGVHGINRPEKFLDAFSPASSAGTGDTAVEGARTGRIGHGASLAYFLVFSNRLSSKFAQRRGPPRVGSCSSQTEPTEGPRVNVAIQRILWRRPFERRWRRRPTFQVLRLPSRDPHKRRRRSPI